MPDVVYVSVVIIFPLLSPILLFFISIFQALSLFCIHFFLFFCLFFIFFNSNVCSGIITTVHHDGFVCNNLNPQPTLKQTMKIISKKLLRLILVDNRRKTEPEH